MKYRIFLSDADDTLFDFTAGERNALLILLRQFSLPADEATRSLYIRINEAHWKKLERGETTQPILRVERFRDFLHAVRLRRDPVAMSEFYMEALSRQKILLPGAVELCQAVSPHMPIYLITNGLSKVQRGRITGCAIEPFLSGIFISEESGHAKPEPHMLQSAMFQAGVADPRQAVFLGDSISADMAAARAAGVDSILYLSGKQAPPAPGSTYVAHTLKEAEKLILQ
ncbi:MAG: HAD-IA family hydrolase [Clostridia bacterium]|nr:HAD-IA family hydrolase [Clostridia bacterium]